MRDNDQDLMVDIGLAFNTIHKDAMNAQETYQYPFFSYKNQKLIRDYNNRPKTSSKARRTLSIIDRQDISVSNLYESGTNNMKSEYTSNFNKKSSITNINSRPFSAMPKKFDGN